MIGDTVKTRAAQFGCLLLSELTSHQEQGDWEHYAPTREDLAIELTHHQERLDRALFTADAAAVTKHAAALANYAMKAHELYGVKSESGK